MVLYPDKKFRKEMIDVYKRQVFAESDMIAKQQYGFSKAEIIKGLCTALVRNYINNLGTVSYTHLQIKKPAASQTAYELWLCHQPKKEDVKWLLKI